MLAGPPAVFVATVSVAAATIRGPLQREGVYAAVSHDLNRLQDISSQVAEQDTHLK